jgi:hypothetical protein
VNLLLLLAYLGLGILSDLFVTAYYIFVGKQWVIPASLISIPIALLNFWVIDKVLIVAPAWDGAIAYAIGNAMGCMIIMLILKTIKRIKNETN